MTTKYEQSMMQNLYWWGIPTLFRCPNNPLKSQDIALIGVPHSTGNGTTESHELGHRRCSVHCLKIEDVDHGVL